jgi:hypothetical protein
VSIDKREDFPAPEGPMMVRNYPLLACPERLFKMWVSVFLSIKERLRH